MDTEKRTPADEGMTALGKALRMSFKLLVLAMMASLFFFLWRSLFVVESKEVGLLFRFGRVVVKDGKAALGEGPHFAWPYPVDEQVRVPTVSQTITVDDLWYSEEEGKTKAMLVPGADGYVVTGDANILHTRWTLRYRITDPLSYALQFSSEKERTATIKALLRNAITNVTASINVDMLYSADRETYDGGDRIVIDRESYRQEVRKAFVRNLAAVKLGIEVEQLAFDWAAPRNLKGSFESVTNAQERSNIEIDKAKGEVIRLKAEAELKAREQIAKAEAERAAIVANAEADKKTFETLYSQYRLNPTLFKKLYFEDRLRRIVEKLDDIYVIDKKAGRTLYLELNPLPKKKKNDGGGND